jgi:hypothetical protein
MLHLRRNLVKKEPFVDHNAHTRVRIVCR